MCMLAVEGLQKVNDTNLFVGSFESAFVILKIY